MKILGHGIDTVSIARFRTSVANEHFVERVFSAAEITYCRGKKDPVPHFAARFAAKEAYGKAVGLGLGGSGDFVEVEVTHNERGAPLLQLSGRAAQLFREIGGAHTFLSLSHDGDQAVASVILASE